MDSGYIKYNNQILKIKILETHGGYKIVQTEDNEILGIPPESGTHIFKTYEECDYFENTPCDWIPM